ncbi:MAG: protein kinase [Deltaproteobacteria bacterium]|nr:protein kinase [Deltaproteobacteria bacterium]
MPRALVIESEEDLRSFVTEALHTAGWDVAVAQSIRPPADEVERADAIITDLGGAVRNGWVGEPAHKPGHAKLIVTSPVKAFLEDVREQVDGVLTTPATRHDVIEAVETEPHDSKGHPKSEPETDRLDVPAPRRAIDEHGIRTATSDPELSAIASLAARAVDAPIGLVTLVDAHQQVFLGQRGLPPDLAAGAWSLCQDAVESDASPVPPVPLVPRVPLVIEDARAHPTLSTNPLVKAGLVRSFAGVPVELPHIGSIGTVCVISDRPRSFDQGHLAALRLAARVAAERLEKIAKDHPIRLSQSSAAPPQLQVGDVIDGKYVVTAALGQGGQARVYLARDRLLGQLVAIKIQLTAADRALLHEARVLARLRHRSIVQLHGWGRIPGGAIYLVLELVDGITLHSRLSGLRRRGELMPMREVLEITRSIGGALATLHSVGLLHGDVKPGNIMLDHALDRAVLIDFGLGMRIDGSSTMAGGTPGWSPPEQLDRDRAPIATPALDAYSLACISYAMLTGRAPFEGSREVLLRRQRTGVITPPHELRPNLCEATDDVLERALAAVPSERFDSPLAFADALDAACAARISLMPRVSLVPRPQTQDLESRGVVFRSLRRSVQVLVGEEEEARAYAGLSPAARRVFESIDDDDALYPTSAYHEYLRVFTGGSPDRIDRLGAVVAKAIAQQALREMRVTRTPETLLHVSADLLHRYHDWGHARVRRIGSHAAVLELGTPDELAPIMCRLFGAILDALIAATGRHTSVLQTACVAEGARSCVFDVRWTDHA